MSINGKGEKHGILKRTTMPRHIGGGQAKKQKMWSDMDFIVQGPFHQGQSQLQKPLLQPCRIV